MSYTLKLDTFNHDITIRNGNFVRINGSNEVCQRVKIALQHYFGEYFLNRQNGLPYYQKNNTGVAILGSKMSQQTVYNLLRKKILAIPGVKQVKEANITHIGRDYYFSCKIIVKLGPLDDRGHEMLIQNVNIGGE